MEETKENLNQEFKNIGGNFFGWKWSFISLGIIILGVIAIVIVKPTDSSNSMFESTKTKVDTSETVIDSLK